MESKIEYGDNLLIAISTLKQNVELKITRDLKPEMTSWHLPFEENINKIKTTYGYILFTIIKSLRKV